MTVQTLLNSIANAVMNELVRVCPVDKGVLRNSISYTIDGDTINFHMSDHWKYVEFGTEPHIIRPVNKKALHWKNGTKDVFAKQVHHPGTDPNPFIRNTFYHKLPGILKKSMALHGFSEGEISF